MQERMVTDHSRGTGCRIGRHELRMVDSVWPVAVVTVAGSFDVCATTQNV